MFRSGPGTVCLCVRSEMSLLTWRVRLCGDGVLVFIGMEWRCCLLCAFLLDFGVNLAPMTYYYGRVVK